MGPLTDNSIQTIAQEQQAVTKTRDALRVEQARKKMPPLNRILNLQDMEVCIMRLLLNNCCSPGPIYAQDVAKKILPYKAFAYYYSAADDEICWFSLHTSLSARHS
jgi:L-lactate dehydrogenase (cytochrome)